MRSLFRFVPVLSIAGLGLALPLAGLADEAPLMPWETGALSLESGLLWQVGDSTSIPYRIVPTQLSWRTSEVFGYGFENGSRVTVRSRFGLLANWVERGPESYYIAVTASPSIEWWNPAGTWAFFGGVGGGVGLTDSRGVEGGQGQDLTFNWFARGGVERFITADSSVTAAIMFLHMSNTGLTDPNPGIDALGFTLGYSWRL